MPNEQITIRATGDGVDESWTTLRSEREDDAVAREILANELSRRFATRPGTYFTDPSYGFDPEDLLGKGITADALARIPLTMASQAEQDERVQTAKAEVVGLIGVGANASIRMLLTVVPRIGEPFRLTLAVSALTVSMLKTENT